MFINFQERNKQEIAIGDTVTVSFGYSENEQPTAEHFHVGQVKNVFYISKPLTETTVDLFLRIQVEGLLFDVRQDRIVKVEKAKANQTPIYKRVPQNAETSETVIITANRTKDIFTVFSPKSNKTYQVRMFEHLDDKGEVYRIAHCNCDSFKFGNDVCKHVAKVNMSLRAVETFEQKAVKRAA